MRDGCASWSADDLRVAGGNEGVCERMERAKRDDSRLLANAGEG